MLITNIFPVLVEALLNPKISHGDKKNVSFPLILTRKQYFNIYTKYSRIQFSFVYEQKQGEWTKTSFKVWSGDAGHLRQQQMRISSRSRWFINWLNI